MSFFDVTRNDTDDKVLNSIKQTCHGDLNIHICDVFRYLFRGVQCGGTSFINMLVLRIFLVFFTLPVCFEI